MLRPPMEAVSPTCLLDFLSQSLPCACAGLKQHDCAIRKEFSQPSAESVRIFTNVLRVSSLFTLHVSCWLLLLFAISFSVVELVVLRVKRTLSHASSFSGLKAAQGQRGSEMQHSTRLLVGFWKPSFRSLSAHVRRGFGRLHYKTQS